METLFETFQGLPNPWIYVLLAFSALLENLIPPIPGDTITAFGAFLAGTGRLCFWGVYLSTTLGSFMGFVCLFLVGGFLGRRFFFERDFGFFKARDILKAEAWFLKFGYFLIAANRFLPGARSVVSLAAGISRLKMLFVAPLALLSCALWNLVWILLGLNLGTHWDLVKSQFSSILFRYQLASAAVLLTILLAWFALKRRKKNHSRLS